MPLSIEQYHRMIELGILESGAPIELIDGFLFRKDRSATGADPMTVGPSHSWAIKRLERLCAGLDVHGCHLRTQQPITLVPDNEPEPDGAIVRGDEDDYLARHPAPSEIICVMEVADSSLQFDRVTKQRIYADAGIPLYLIVNLLNGAVEAHRDPIVGGGRYRNTETLDRGGVIKISLPDGAAFELAVARMLPK